MKSLLHPSGLTRIGAPRAIFAALAVLFFAVVQIAFSTHAASKGVAPDHASDCVLCVALGGGHGAAPQSSFILAAPVFAAAIFLVLIATASRVRVIARFSARAPPAR